MIKVFALVNGMNVIADVESYINGVYKVTNPQLIFETVEKNVQKMGFVPMTKYAGSVAKGTIVEIKDSMCVFSPYEPDTNLANHYSEVFGSGIIVPTMELIKG